KVYPEDHAGARRAVDSFVPHLDDGCIGSVSEVFDAQPPFASRGCIAQAWSVAELLRVWVRLLRQAASGGDLMAKDNRIQSGILGDINPIDSAKKDRTAHSSTVGAGREEAGQEEIEAMEGG